MIQYNDIKQLTITKNRNNKILYIDCVISMQERSACSIWNIKLREIGAYTALICLLVVYWYIYLARKYW
jgi:hypothetical protein